MQQPHIVSRGHTRPLTEISFVQDPNGSSILVSSAHDKLPQIRNGETGDWVGTFQGHKGAAWSAKVDSRTRTLAATASGDFTAKLWCATTGKELHEFKHKHVVKSIDFSHDSARIASGCQDGLVRLFDTARPEAGELHQLAVGAKSSEAPTKVVFAGQDSCSLLVGTRQGTLQLWDSRGAGEAAKQVNLLTSVAPPAGVAEPGAKSMPVPTTAAVMDVELSPDKTTALVTVGRKVCCVSLPDLNILWQYAMPDPLSFSEEGGASLHPTDGSRFIAGGSDLWLREFDVKSGEVLRTFKGHHGPVRCIRYHPSGDMVASGSEDATIRLWDLRASSA